MKFDDANAVANIAAFMANPRDYIQKQAAHYGLVPGAPPPAQPTNGKPAWEKPVPMLSSEDGRKAYDAEAVDAYFAHLEGQLNELRDQMGPLNQMHEDLTAEQIATNARQYGTDMVEFAKTWAGFDELAADVLELMKTDRRWTIESAYNRLMQTKYFPSLEGRHRKAFMDELNKRPATPQGPAPGAQTRRPSGDRKGMSVRQAIEHAVERASA